MRRCTGLNESVWSAGTPQGPSWAFWALGGPKRVVRDFEGGGAPPRLALLLALSWANRVILTYLLNDFTRLLYYKTILLDYFTTRLFY